ncbi:unnamed protein product [Clonostachys rhizophaga]|uniref:Uncharacterized protein n=1 Tax=Clonostachys rhizophaga TaxID=160324 RepID=A0A9N9VL59_9HYPO|nr:unnamed protein product [Clonostachys rhizophaga]
MAEERPPYHDNDVGPFASVEYTLAREGSSPKELDLKLRDRNVLLVVELDDTNARALHLQNARQDTLTEAQYAVDKFLDRLAPLENSNSGHTVFQMFDRVRDEIAGPVDVAVVDIDDLMSRLTGINNDELKYPKKSVDTTSKDGPDSNPVAEIIAACGDFLSRVSSSGESRLKRDASILTRASESVHLSLQDYMEKQALKRYLGFNWYTPSYPEERIIRKQPKYHIYYDEEDEGWRHKKGNYSVPPWSTRGQESG